MDDGRWHFPHKPHHHKHPRDVFHHSAHSNLHVSIFDDLPAGTTTCSTSFKTGDGGTVHITRTVIGGDGSVRREMRFRTPSASGRAPPPPGADQDRSRGQRRQQPEPEPGRAHGRSRQPSRSAPHMERRGEPDGAPTPGNDS